MNLVPIDVPEIEPSPGTVLARKRVLWRPIVQNLESKRLYVVTALESSPIADTRQAIVHS